MAYARSDISGSLVSYIKVSLNAWTSNLAFHYKRSAEAVCSVLKLQEVVLWAGLVATFFVASCSKLVLPMTKWADKFLYGARGRQTA
jgi:hypothetical protein